MTSHNNVLDGDDDGTDVCRLRVYRNPPGVFYHPFRSGLINFPYPPCLRSFLVPSYPLLVDAKKPSFRLVDGMAGLVGSLSG
ncbi:kinesin light chain, putative [Anopheles sinensis]|uniref:Kinesin light chain, putative n=1 Tax=Anopheles sinensis TaxID=74873 RepID=A0A084VA68_ANOSI|nr:kinesin light chain, putative [Anopheles sinensis]